MKNSASTTLQKFIIGSKTFSGIIFQGIYGMPTDHFLKILDHYITTGQNLLDSYSHIIHTLMDENDEVYGKKIIDQSEYNRIISAISNPFLRDFFKEDDLDKCYDIVREWHNNYLIYNQKKPNLIRSKACRFTAKKGIKEAVFLLHGTKCLCCGACENISLDHVIPIQKGGENIIHNLQPLCKSCNSKKGIKIIDYRKNG